MQGGQKRKSTEKKASTKSETEGPTGPSKRAKLHVKQGSGVCSKSKLQALLGEGNTRENNLK